MEGRTARSRGLIFIAFLACSVISLHAERVTMRIGHTQPITTPRHVSLKRFKDLVESRSGRTIKVQIYPAGQLGDEAALLEGVQRGTVQGARVGLFDRVSPKLVVYMLPFLFDRQDAIEAVLSGPIGDRIAKEAEKNGFAILATGDAGGFRQITNNERPIVSPEDLEGLRIRVPADLIKVKTLEAFGATAVSIPYGETYAALKAGAVDGQENPFVNIASMKFHEVQKYLTVIDFQFHPDPFVVNLEWFRSLRPDQQRLLQDCARESMRLSDKLMKEANVSARRTVAKAMEIVELNQEQRAAFRLKAKAVYDYYIGAGIVTQAEIDEIRAISRP